MINSEYNILLPINFSIPNEKLMDSLVSFSKHVKYNLFVLTVVEDDSNVELALKKLRDYVKAKDLEAICVVRTGKLANEVLNYSKEIAASIVILNLIGKDINKPNYINPEINLIIRKSLVPVIVLKNNLDFTQISSILLPLDINFENKKKISNALFYAKFFQNSVIRIISVTFDSSDYEVNRQVFQLQHIVNFVEKSGCECTGELMRCKSEYGDSLGKIVCDYAEKSEAELVLLLTDHEENKTLFGLNEDSDYMLKKLSNCIISITP